MQTSNRTQQNKMRSDSHVQPAANTTGKPSLPLQDNRTSSIAQLKLVNGLSNATSEFPIQKKSNNTGLPDNLKSGIENLSGHSMDDVKVHYNSSQPAQLNAHAYAQGTNIHIAPGQEKHLPHEAWHVVQQKQGRVKPTLQMKGKYINDNRSLENEADVMGTKAIQLMAYSNNNPARLIHSNIGSGVSQLQTYVTWTTQNFQYNNVAHGPIQNQIVGKTMIADLDPANMIVGNVSAGGGMTALFGSLGANWVAGGGGWRRGHLLNDHLGGPNTYPNLFPITAHANSDHSHAVEGHVKDWIRANRDVRYEVTATQDPGMTAGIRNAGGNFHCYAYTTDALPRLVVNKTILSRPVPIGIAPVHAGGVVRHINNWWQHDDNSPGNGNVGNHGLLAANPQMNAAARIAWENNNIRRGWFSNDYHV